MNELDVQETPGFEEWRPFGVAPKLQQPVEKTFTDKLLSLWRTFAARVEAADVLLLVGLTMLGVGFRGIYSALGWIVPGAILVWHQLPQRDRFVKPLPPVEMPLPQMPFQRLRTEEDTRGPVR